MTLPENEFRLTKNEKKLFVAAPPFWFCPLQSFDQLLNLIPVVTYKISQQKFACIYMFEHKFLKCETYKKKILSQSPPSIPLQLGPLKSGDWLRNTGRNLTD